MNLTPVGDVISRVHSTGSTAGEITEFDGMSVGLQDLAVAATATRFAIEQRLAQEVKLWHDVAFASVGWREFTARDMSYTTSVSPKNKRVPLGTNINCRFSLRNTERKCTKISHSALSVA